LPLRTRGKYLSQAKAVSSYWPFIRIMFVTVLTRTKF